MQRNATAHHACAACKHQRKKCAEDCPLAPYFTQDKSHSFQAVHKLFGVANVSKLIKSIESHEDRERAIQSLIWEAECRERDPVLGCWGQYSELYAKCVSLERVLQQRMIYAPNQCFNRWNSNANMGISSNGDNIPYMDNGENLLIDPAPQYDPYAIASNKESEVRDPSLACSQNPIASFDQQFYQDQLNRINAKAMDDDRRII